MDYIKMVGYELQMVKNHNIKWVDQPFVTYINHQLKPYLTNLTLQSKLIKKVFGFKRKIPIILNQHCLLICIQSYRCSHAFYLNYYNIKSWRQEAKSVIISFVDGHEMRLESLHIFKKQMIKINHLLSNKHKIKIIP